MPAEKGADPEVSTLQPACNVHDVPLAIDLATAALILQRKTARQTVEQGGARRAAVRSAPRPPEKSGGRFCVPIWPVG